MDEFKKDLKDVEKNIISMLQDLQEKYDINIEAIYLDCLTTYGQSNRIVNAKIKFDIK